MQHNLTLGQAQPFTAIYMPIDVQIPYVRELKHNRDKTFASAVNQTANDLREENALIAWTVFDMTDNPTIMLSNNRVKRKAQLYELGLDGIDVADTDVIIPKRGMDAFSNPLVANLRNGMPEAPLILSGTNTTQCVFNTLASALAQPVAGACVVVYDRLADPTNRILAYGRENDPQTHKRALEDMLTKDETLAGQKDKVSFTTANNLLRGLRAGGSFCP